MKTTMTLIILLFIGVLTTHAQSNFINYQGVASDNSGVMQSKPIVIQIALKFGTSTATASYAETHDVTTDAHGIFSLQIGSGTVDFGNYNELTWGNQKAFITTSIDGTEIGTTELHAVPFALNAGNTAKKIDDLEDGKSDTSGFSLFLGKDAGKNDNNINNINLGIGPNALKNNTNGTSNTAIGSSALSTNISGNYNSAFGSSALQLNTTGNGNSAFGLWTLFSNTTGENNTAVGGIALANNTTGKENTALGGGAMYSNTDGENNTAVGFNSLYNNTTGNNNTAVGYNSMNKNTTGNDNTAQGYLALSENIGGLDNTANGVVSLVSNTNGSNNTALGKASLNKNTNGNDNTALGKNAMYSNLSGSFNVANGSQSLFSNTTGFNNIAIGGFTLYSNESANNNVAIGNRALFSNETGNVNVAIGTGALESSKSGYTNIAIGGQALYNIIAPNGNVAVGYGALRELQSGANNIGVGDNANVPNANGDSQVRIGNTNITYAGIQVAWTVTSDKRWKDQIRPLPYGLNMVTRLNPVDYIRKNNDKQTKEIGFIAQDVEKVLNELRYNDQGFLTKDDKGYISLRYNDLIPVLTKAIQEQQELINELQAKNDEHDTNYKNLLSRLETLETKKDTSLEIEVASIKK